jgi:hypothetical protein
MKPSTPGGIHLPRLPKQLTTQVLTSVEESAEYAALSLSGCDLTRQAAVGLVFEQVRFRRVVFTSQFWTG